MTVPATGVPTGHAKVKVPALIVAAAMSLLKAALMIVLFSAIPVALFTGATAVTVGTGKAKPPTPRIGSRPWSPPPPPPHPANKPAVSNAMNHGRTMQYFSNFFIFFSLLMIQKPSK